MSRPLRVIHAPTAVGGHPGALARAERELGLDSTALALLAPRYGHAVDEVLTAPGAGPGRRACARARLLWRMRNADAVHFNFGSSLLPVPASRSGVTGMVGRALALRDLALLRRLGKTVVVTFQGDDARQARIGGLLVEAVPEHYTPALDAARRVTIEAFDRHAAAIFYLNPDLSAVLPARARFLPYASVDPQAWAVHAEDDSGPPLVVHAPSDPRVKGTDAVIAAVESLRAEGVPLRFELLHGVGRDAVRSALEHAAVVVDQLNAGWYGGFAVEAMALGKPVLSSVGTVVLPCVPTALREELPVVDVSAATLAGRLRTLLLAPAERARLGAAGRAYVERWHDPRIVAQTVIEAYRP